MKLAMPICRLRIVIAAMLLGMAVAVSVGAAGAAAGGAGAAGGTGGPAGTGGAQGGAAEPSPAGFHGAGGLTGTAPESPAPPYRLSWTYRAHPTERAPIDGQPLRVGDTVYLADGLGTIHALDRSTGKPRWTLATGDSFETTALFLDGRLLIGDLSGVLHCVDALSGKALWTLQTEASIHCSSNTDGRRVYFGNDAGFFHAVDPVSGKIVWTREFADRINGAPAIDVAASMAYIAGCDARLRAIALADGAEKWVADLGALSGGSPVLAGDRIVVGTDQGKVIAVDRSGKRVWTYEQVRNQAMVYATAAVADGMVVIGARDRRVHAIDLASGKPRWTFATRGEVDCSAVISSRRVYVGSKDKTLYVLDLNSGKKLWSFAAERAITAAPAVGGDGLIVADTGGNVYGLEAEGTEARRH